MPRGLVGKTQSLYKGGAAGNFVTDRRAWGRADSLRQAESAGRYLKELEPSFVWHELREERVVAEASQK